MRSPISQEIKKNLVWYPWMMIHMVLKRQWRVVSVGTGIIYSWLLLLQKQPASCSGGFTSVIKLIDWTHKQEQFESEQTSRTMKLNLAQNLPSALALPNSYQQLLRMIMRMMMGMVSPASIKTFSPSQRTSTGSSKMTQSHAIAPWMFNR